jgi:dephospho-CoA kinase
MIIGITGTDGAGKGTVVDYLVTKKGFTHYSSRDLLLAEIIKAGIEPTRNELRLMGNKMRAEYGDDVIVQKALEHIETDGVTHAVVESIRAIAEAQTLKSQGALLLAVDADLQIRYERVQKRRSEKDQVTYETFVAQEELEKNDPDPHGMQKAKVIEMADYTIFNDGTLEELEDATDAFLAQYDI